jgi:hypothetical protein
MNDILGIYSILALVIPVFVLVCLMMWGTRHR